MILVKYVRGGGSWLLLGVALACRPQVGGSHVISPAASDLQPPAKNETTTESDEAPAASPEGRHEVRCLRAPEAPIPACVDSRQAKVALPLARALYVVGRSGSLEVGGLAASNRDPGRADRSDAAYVQLEGDRVTQVVRDEDSGKRRAFLTQASGYRLRSSDGALSLWRSKDTSLDLGVKQDLAATDGEHARLLALGGDPPDSVVIAYERRDVNEEGKTTKPSVAYTKVGVTSGPPSAWSLAPWSSLGQLSSPTLLGTERGIALAGLEDQSEGRAASLVVEWLPEPGGALPERLSVTSPGVRLNALGDVELVGERWVAAAAFEGETSPDCAKAVSLSGADEPKFERAGFEGGEAGSPAGFALVSSGPRGSQTLVLATGALVTAGHVAELDPARVAVSFCTRKPDSCYLAVISLDEGAGVLCSTASGSTPAPLAVEDGAVVWVENRLRTVELNRATAMKGLALEMAPATPAPVP